MGGAASVLIWTIGYDPVFTAVEVATCTCVPSYVDDGEILAHGPCQVVAASVMLLVAGHCAGLLAEAHACRWLEARGLHCQVMATVSILPVEWGSADDGWARMRVPPTSPSCPLAGGDRPGLGG